MAEGMALSWLSTSCVRCKLLRDLSVRAIRRCRLGWGFLSWIPGCAGGCTAPACGRPAACCSRGSWLAGNGLWQFDALFGMVVDRRARPASQPDPLATRPWRPGRRLAGRRARRRWTRRRRVAGEAAQQAAAQVVGAAGGGFERTAVGRSERANARSQSVPSCSRQRTPWCRPQDMPRRAGQWTAFPMGISISRDLHECA